MLIRNAECDGQRVDLRIEGDRITEIGGSLDQRSDPLRLDARGGALLPGLHDHHLHILSLAASFESVDCGPPAICDVHALRSAIEAAPRRGDTIRGVNYFESVAGPLDRNRLDAFCPDHPLRIQHRSGSMWFLNSRAIESLDFDASDRPEGVEVDASGRITGRFFRVDTWLRKSLPRRADLDLTEVGEWLARHGVTGVTDATPSNAAREVEWFRKAQTSGALPQRLCVMGSAELADLASDAELSIGAFKILLDEPALPSLEDLAESIRRIHEKSRPVAIHTVTRSEIHFALAAIEMAGPLPGDRLEHASVASPEAVEAVRRFGVSIVTQPNFVADRGDAYIAEVAARDRPFLYRLRTWIDAEVPLGGGTDAPFGRPDPWWAMRAAVERRTTAGRPLGDEEALTPEQALALFLGPLEDPGGAPRKIEVGGPADLCLLDCPWQEARLDLDAGRVLATVRAGRLLFMR